MGRYLEAAVGGNGNYSALLPIVTHHHERDADVDRRRQGLHARLRSDSGLARIRAGGGDFCGAGQRPEFREERLHAVLRREHPQGLVQPAERLDRRRDRSSTKCSRVCRSTSAIRGAGSRTSRSPTTGPRAPADYTPFSVTAPLDPRLPGGGGYVVSGLFNIVPAEVQYRSTTTGRMRRTTGTSLRSTTESTSTSQPGCGTACSFRPAPTPGSVSRTTAKSGRSCRSRVKDRTAGFSTGSEVPAYSPTNPYCHYAPGIDTRITAAGTYTIPKIDVLVSGTLHEQPRAFRCGQTGPYRAPWLRSGSAGRSPGNAPNVRVNLLKPDDMRSDRVNTARLPRREDPAVRTGTRERRRSTCTTR